MARKTESKNAQSRGSRTEREEVERLREELDERLAAIEARVEEGLGSLEQRVSNALGDSEDDEALKAEIEQSLNDFERRLKKNLKAVRGTDDSAQVTELFSHVLEAAQGVRELLTLERAKKAWGEFRMRGRSDTVDDYGMDPIFERRFKPLFDFLFYDYWRVDVRGIEHVPADGRALIVANHSGALPYDGSMVKIAVLNEHPQAREVRFLVEDFAYHFPFLGTFMNRIGGVRACRENAIRLLNHDELVVVFPEGVKGLGKLYKQRYRLQRFGRGGFVNIALRTHSPLVPLAIVGAEEIHPMIGKASFLAQPLGIPYIPITPTFPWLGMLGMIPLPTKWFMQFGKPLDFTDFPESAIQDRILVNKTSQQVRQNIQEMIMDLLKDRRSLFFG